MLFDIEKANKAWDSVYAKYSKRYDKEFTAWERLSYFYRHEYNRHYDGGILRVIAMFAEGMVCVEGEMSVTFQAGPGTYCVGTDVNHENPEKRYLLNILSDIVKYDEHINYYVKSYVNTWHNVPGKRSEGTDFSKLCALLEEELDLAQKNRDYTELNKLRKLRDMLVVLTRWK